MLFARKFTEVVQLPPAAATASTKRPEARTPPGASRKLSWVHSHGRDGDAMYGAGGIFVESVNTEAPAIRVPRHRFSGTIIEP